MKGAISETLRLLDEAMVSFENAKKPGYNAYNWHLNAWLCVEKATAEIQALKARIPEGLGKLIEVYSSADLFCDNNGYAEPTEASDYKAIRKAAKILYEATK